MVKHLPSGVPTKDPYSLLALTMLEEAFRTIRCYFSNTGSKDELIEGRRAIHWIQKMEGTYKLTAMASGYSLGSFHQMCIWKINQIREEVISEKSAVGRKDKQGEICREEHTQMDTKVL